MRGRFAAISLAWGLSWLSLQPAAAAEATAEAGLAKVARWVVERHDNAGMPFIVIDKVAAVVAVFDAQGREQGSAAALVGLTVGDEMFAAQGPPSEARPYGHQTPAGRFPAVLGPARRMPDVLWLDLERGLSLHRVLTANKNERRPERLNSPSPEDNRITMGCINVPDTFYEHVVRPTFWLTRGVVYVLPETRPLTEVFPHFGEAVQSSR